MIDPGEKIEVDAPVSPINHVDNLSTIHRQLDTLLLTNVV